jgi:hypothetical protein
VIVALALRTLEDVGDDGQTLIAGSGLLEVRIDFPLRGNSRLLASLLALFRIAVDEDLAGLIGVQFAGALAVGLGQVVLGGAGLDAEQVVKGDIGTLCGSDFIAEAEDFMVCGPRLAQLLLDGPRGACAQPGECCRRRVGAAAPLDSGMERTLFGPGSSERRKDTQHERKQGVGLHGGRCWR